MILHEDDTVTFVHSKSGTVLDFSDNLPFPLKSTRDVNYQDFVDKILNKEFSYKIRPLKHSETVKNTLLNEADFYLLKEVNGSILKVESYSDKTIDTSDPNKRPGEARFHTAPKIKDQEFIDEELFELAGPNIIRFKLAADSTKLGNSIFSIVKLEDTWKQEIELAQSMSSIMISHYYKYINPINRRENNIYN